MLNSQFKTLCGIIKAYSFLGQHGELFVSLESYHFLDSGLVVSHCEQWYAK